MSATTRLRSAFAAPFASTGRRRASFVALHVVILVLAFLLEAPVPRAESKDWWSPSRFEETRGGLSIQMVPPGSFFAAERLWHLTYLPLPIRLYAVFLLPATMATATLFAAIHVFFQDITPWVHSWLVAAVFIPVSSLQLWLLAGPPFWRQRNRNAPPASAGGA